MYLLLTRWWDMRLEHNVTWLWEKWADRWNVCLKRKEILLVLYYINKNWNEKNYCWRCIILTRIEMKRSFAHAVLYWWDLVPFYQRISRIIFKICFTRRCLPNRVIKRTYFGNFTLSHTHFVDQNRWANVGLDHWINNMSMEES